MSVEELSIALVREYLARKGLKKTLDTLNTESPKTSDALSSRSELAKQLHITKIYKKNKESDSPLNTMLEVMAKYFVDKSSSSSSSSSTTAQQKDEDEEGTPPPPPFSTATTSRPKTSSSSTVSPFQRTSSIGKDPTESLSASLTFVSRDRDRDNSPKGTRGVPTVSAAAVSRASANTSPVITRTFTNPTPPSPVGTLGKPPKTSSRGSLEDSPKKSSKDLAEMMVEDFSDEEPVEALSGKFTKDVRVSPYVPTAAAPQTRGTDSGRGSGGRLIDGETAAELKRLMFGSLKGGYNPEWRMQSFVFNDVPGIEYGFVQHKGGPCGVLACVQAFVIKHLLFGEKSTRTPIRAENLRPTPKDRSDALILALADILWQAGARSKTAIVATTGTQSASCKAGYEPDQITDRLCLQTCGSYADTVACVQSNIAQFTAKDRNGVIVFMYSAILSRTIKGVREDMDEAGGRLMGSHNYCTQDLVNLLITGTAASNTHDGAIVLGDGDSKDKMVLKGIESDSQIGLLSLFEHYGSCKVGSRLKCPLLPIWVIYAESHFTVLFSHNLELTGKECDEEFNIVYYDQLAQQEAPFKLTVDPHANVPPPKAKDLIPPLVHCIRTKWRGAAVDWNGSDPMY